MYKLREILEGLAAATAAKEATEEDLDKIKKTLIAEENYLKETAKKYNLDDIPPTFFEDVDFHAAIANVGNNQLLKQRLSMLKAQISFTFIMLRDKTSNLAEQYRVFEEHTMIYNAIVRGWNDIAEMLMKRHISDARSKYVGLLNSVDEDRK